MTSPADTGRSLPVISPADPARSGWIRRTDHGGGGGVGGGNGAGVATGVGSPGGTGSTNRPRIGSLIPTLWVMRAGPAPVVVSTVMRMSSRRGEFGSYTAIVTAVGPVSHP